MGRKSELADDVFRLVTSEGRKYLDPHVQERPWVTPQAVRVTEFGFPSTWRGTTWYRFLADIAPDAVKHFGGVAVETTYGLGKKREPDTDRLLDRFINVDHDGVDEALDLAHRVGPLRLCACHALPREACPTPSLEREGLLPEPLLAWYLWARETWVVIHLISALKRDAELEDQLASARRFALGSLEAWSALQAVKSLSYDAETETFSGPLGAYAVSTAELRLAGTLLRGDEPDRELCLEAIAARIRRWMAYGEVRPRLEVNPPRSFRFELTGHGLFGALAKRLCFVALGQDDWLICHHCRAPFTPTQKVRSNQKLVFCSDCRDAGQPQRYRMRRYRARKRGNGDD